MRHSIARRVGAVAAVVTGLVTLWGQGLDGIMLPRELTAVQAERECRELTISQPQINLIDQIRDETASVDAQRPLTATECETLGVSDGAGTAIFVPDALYLVCWTDNGGRVLYDVSDGGVVKTVEPAGRDVWYENRDNAVYRKYTSQVLWPKF